MLRVSNKQKRKDTSSGRICNSLPKTSSRCLRKTCSRRLQDVFFKTSSIFLQEDVLQLYLEDVFETSSVRLHQTNVCWGHAWGVGGGGVVISQCGALFATSNKGLPLPVSLTKKKIYLYTQLKGERTDLL